MPQCAANVRFGSKADMCSAQPDVRFVPIADIGKHTLRSIEVLFASHEHSCGFYYLACAGQKAVNTEVKRRPFFMRSLLLSEKSRSPQGKIKGLLKDFRRADAYGFAPCRSTPIERHP